MAGQPATTLLRDVVFCAASVGMTMKVEAPVEIIWNWRMIPNKKDDIKSIDFEICQRHDQLRYENTMWCSDIVVSLRLLVTCSSAGESI